MFRRFGLLVIACGLTLPLWSAERSGSISGYVRDAGGVPQMGAVVEVLGAAAQSVHVFTDEKGYFSAADLIPGAYNIKVSAASFSSHIQRRHRSPARLSRSGKPYAQHTV